MSKKLNLNQTFFKLREKHHFHLVDNSQLPIITAFASMLVVLSIAFYLHFVDSSVVHSYDNMTFQTAWFFFSAALFSWFITVVRESARGYHTLVVRQGLRYGMLLFIVSEVMFFFAFFWAFFHVSLAPAIAIGGIWPPKSIQALDIWGLPLVNTLLLLSSGVTITLAHWALLQKLNYGYSDFFKKHLLVTIILGVVFLCCQGIEYKYGVTFRWKENVYGSTFFVTTGFHGLHVTIGTIFLLFCLLRSLLTASRFWGYALSPWFLKWKHVVLDYNIRQEMKRTYPMGLRKLYTKKESVPTKFLLNIADELWRFPQEENKFLMKVRIVQTELGKYAFTKDQHFGFEAAAWYWHFVDVVWIFLFITIYWWGC